MGLKAFLSHPLTVAILGTVASTGIITAGAALKDIKPFTAALVQPVTVPLWLVVSFSAMALLSALGLWIRARSRRKQYFSPRRYVPDEVAEAVIAVMRATDQAVEDDALVEHIAKLAPAHVGRRDIQLAIETLAEARWIKVEPIHMGLGYGYGLTALALEFCRLHNIVPSKPQRPSPPPGMSYVD
jgi:hypothetical protein